MIDRLRQHMKTDADGTQWIKFEYVKQYLPKENRKRFGEDNANSKLTQSQVNDIRKYLKEGIKPPTLAKWYLVKSETIYAIKWGRTWREKCIN